jgi:hypothetical protein
LTRLDDIEGVHELNVSGHLTVQEELRTYKKLGTSCKLEQRPRSSTEMGAHLQ